MEIRAVDEELATDLIRRTQRARNGEMRKLIKEFVASEMAVCEFVSEHYNSASSARSVLKSTIRSMKLNLSTVVLNERVYMVKPW